MVGVKAFCILVCGLEGIERKKMPYFMYLMQCSGFDLKYNYTIKNGSLKSHGLIGNIADQVSMGLLENNYKLTELGVEQVDNYPVTLLESDLLDLVTRYVQTLDTDDLFALCLTDILINEISEQGGADALIQNKSTILETLGNLVPNFTEVDLNSAVRVLRELKGVLKGA